MKKRVLIFAPHPDDETLGCGGTIARKVNRGEDVEVFFMTDGRNALSTMFGIFSNPSPAEFIEIRRNEALRATGVLGLTEDNLVFLEAEDGCLAKESVYVQERIKELIAKKSYSEFYFPSDADSHPDHRVTNSIARNLIHELGGGCKSYTYIIHYDRIMALRMFIGLRVTHNLIGSDISEFLHLKRKALDEYRSQISIMTDRQKSPVLDRHFLAKFLTNTEIFSENRS